MNNETLAGDIVEQLVAAGLLEVFAKLPPSHQKEYLQWVDEAKRPETRTKRLQKMCEMLTK